MQEALGILGYPNPYHYASLFRNVKDSDYWQELLDAKFNHNQRIDGQMHFDKLLGHCGAVSDVPCVLFWEELVEAYPDAKVVIVERTEDQWARSFEELVDGALNPVATYVLRYTDPAWLGRINVLAQAWIEAFLGTSNLAKGKKNMRSAYRAHYATIRAKVPREKILEYKLGSGWDPLCKFLGKDVPDVPFPHRNEAKMLQNAIGAFIGKALRHSLFNMLMVVGLPAFIGALAWQLSP